jgi:BR serine/threonine kinase
MKWSMLCNKGQPRTDSGLQETAGRSRDKSRRTDSSTPWHPPSIGRYNFSGKMLGRGATGSVFHGRCSETGVDVAIKVLEASSSGTPTEVAALRKIASAGHPHICGFLEHHHKHGKHFIVMEACTGGELFQQVESVGHVSEERARRLVKGVVSGTVFMHSRGVAHRDLKLENILLDAPDGDCAKICDLGLAHVYESCGDGTYAPVKLTRCCGTKSYTPPEVLAGMPYDGFLVDVWSLGVCLFAMCAGFFPLEVVRRARELAWRHPGRAVHQRRPTRARHVHGTRQSLKCAPSVRVQARSCDWRFQRLYVAQQEGRSTCRTIFGFYERTCPFTPALVELLDGMIVINPRRRMTMSAVAASAWLSPAPLPHLSLEAMGVSCSSIGSSAESPSSDIDLKISDGDDSNFVNPKEYHRKAFSKEYHTNHVAFLPGAQAR